MLKDIINKLVYFIKYKDNFIMENDLTPEAKTKAKPGPKPGWKTELEIKMKEVLMEKGNNQSLYLVEGLVKLETKNNESAQSEQKRIIWASNVQEAMEKYTAHFSDLNNQNSVYTVVNMFVSEAIF
jgi:hypothetical protein